MLRVPKFCSDLVNIYLVDPYTMERSWQALSLLVRTYFNVSAFSGELLDSVDHT
jgi:hypothetical protein